MIYEIKCEAIKKKANLLQISYFKIFFIHMPCLFRTCVIMALRNFLTFVAKKQT